jgi:hypothetical protein
MNIIDLDILRPDPVWVKIGGRKIDVSFVPCGITFDLDAIVQQLVKLDGEKVKSDPVEMRKAFDLGVQLCAIFCEHSNPDMTEKWFRDNATAPQISGFTNAIQSALIKSYEGAEAHAKN